MALIDVAEIKQGDRFVSRTTPPVVYEAYGKAASCRCSGRPADDQVCLLVYNRTRGVTMRLHCGPKTKFVPVVRQ